MRMNVFSKAICTYNLSPVSVNVIRPGSVGILLGDGLAVQILIFGKPSVCIFPHTLASRVVGVVGDPRVDVENLAFRVEGIRRRNPVIDSNQISRGVIVVPAKVYLIVGTGTIVSLEIQGPGLAHISKRVIIITLLQTVIPVREIGDPIEIVITIALGM